MLRRRLLAVAILLLAQGCGGHGDLVTTLRIEGDVRKAGSVVSDVKVYFVDTGLDESGRRAKVERLVGSTDKDGRLTIVWKYFWGYTYFSLSRGMPDPSKKVPGTFELRFKKDDVGEAVTKYRLWSLEKRGKEYIVPFDVSLR